MKKLLLLLAAACSALIAPAQSTRSILDAAAARMTKSGGVRATFKATQFRGTTPESETTGTLLISGRKFQVQTPDVVTWFNGQTQWSMLTESNEVNISEPTNEEQAGMNPATLVNIYKQGYSYTHTKGTLRGKDVYTVHLRAKNRRATFAEIYLDVEQTNYNPLCIRLRRDGNWSRLAILTFQPGQTFAEATFNFPSKEHPDVEVIDLR